MKNIEDQYRNIEVQPRQESWQKLANRLAQDQAPQRRIVSLIPRIALIAASLLLLMLATKPMWQSSPQPVLAQGTVEVWKLEPDYHRIQIIAQTRRAYAAMEGSIGIH